jgi:TPR repeat protein
MADLEFEESNGGNDMRGRVALQTCAAALIFIASLLVAPDSHAELTNNDGVAAFEAGHPEQAFLIWREVAIKTNSASAQTNLANCYRGGVGVEKNYAEAIAWYEKAAKQGYPLAYYGLGTMYDKGWGVPQDHAKAAQLWTHCATTVPQCQYNFGILLYKGSGIAPDKARAIELFKAAAAKGYRPASDVLKEIGGSE